jgi:Fe2+ or Zn2+ uptake regulation protein
MTVYRKLQPLEREKLLESVQKTTNNCCQNPSMETSDNVIMIYDMNPDSSKPDCKGGKATCKNCGTERIFIIETFA